MPSSPLIAIISDFGDQDPFVGIMKGVIAQLSPGTKIVDITHQIPPGDILRAAVMLWQSSPFFPPGSIFLSVVDPGVGSSRKGLFLQSKDHIFIGPDNGLFTFVRGTSSRQWQLENGRYQLPEPSMTFHGRDIFAPAAAFAANGVTGSEFGSKVDQIQLLTNPHYQLDPLQLEGEILYNDKFGNLLTSLGVFNKTGPASFAVNPWLDNESGVDTPINQSKDQASLKLADGRELPWVDTFADLQEGECGAVIGSSGLMEIVANRNSAAELLGIGSGEIITLKF